MQSVLFHLMIQCALWSLMAIGGNTVALSDIHRYTVTDIPLRFQTIGERFLGRSLGTVNKVDW